MKIVGFGLCQQSAPLQGSYFAHRFRDSRSIHSSFFDVQAIRLHSSYKEPVACFSVSWDGYVDASSAGSVKLELDTPYTSTNLKIGEPKKSSPDYSRLLYL